jgi:hypothetical protein
MSSGVAKHAVGTAIRAKEKFLPKGTLTGERFNLLREIAIGTVLGVSAGMVWKVCVASSSIAKAMVVAFCSVACRAEEGEGFFDLGLFLCVRGCSLLLLLTVRAPESLVL